MRNSIPNENSGGAGMSEIQHQCYGWRIARRLVDAAFQPFLFIFGWRFPAYFHLRDKVKMMTVGIEPDLQRFVAAAIAPGETVLDVGANVGFLARLFCRCVGPAGHVLAFEPEPDNLQALRYNLKSYPQAKVHDCAISDSNQPAIFYLNRVSGAGNSLVPHVLGTTQIRVSCQTLDSFLGQHPEVRPDWVKIDVEGGEFHVLRGMRDTVRLFPDMKLLIELCPENLGGIKPAELLVAELLGMGFTLHLIDQNGSIVPFQGMCAHRDAFISQGYVNLYSVR